MMLYGSIVNVICIVIGSFIGLFLTKLHDKYKETVMQGISLTVLFIGFQMAFTTGAVTIVLLSIVFGAIIGELLQLENWLHRLGLWVENKCKRKDHKPTNIGQGFVTAALLFVIGAMAILGALDSGLRGDHELLVTKSVLDGFTSLVLTSILGIGVMFSALPVFVFQGTITILATKIEALIPESMLHELINEITAVGGIMIVAIGLNLLKLTSIRVTNLLPALPVAGLIIYIRYLL